MSDYVDFAERFYIECERRGINPKEVAEYMLSIADAEKLPSVILPKDKETNGSAHNR